MFYYFGYGSNMSVASLRAKGVHPLSSEPAVLEGWELKFNIPDFFLIEGGTGNIVPSPIREVHGVLHSCVEESSEILDALEAVGVNYQRIKVLVTTYQGQQVSAYAYVGLDEKLREGYQPSRRYLNILQRGAEAMGLAPRYLAYLRSLEVKTEPVYRPFRFPAGPNLVFTRADLGLTDHLTALAGAVFDLTDAREDHAYLKKFLAGRDMTLFFLNRMDSSLGLETDADIRENRLTSAQRRYLNQYLHEFDREYHLVGTMDYALDLRHPNAGGMKAASKARAALSARSVIELAEITNETLGHENLGFLSFSHGFLPKANPRLKMPKAFKAWDDIIARLPELYRTLQLRATLDALPPLDASEDQLADGYLLRGAAILAMLAHAYNYVEVAPGAGIPEGITRPWGQIRARLCREQEVLSYIDLIIYNWRLLDAASEDPYRVENMDLLIPTVGNQEECVFYLTQTEILARSAPIIGAIARAQDAVRADDKISLEAELRVILKALETVVYESLPKINPNPASRTYVDAVTWAKTVAPFAVPMKTGVQGPSGTSSPLFNLMDVFLGRKKFETILGREIKELRGTYPQFWREFIAAVGEVSVANYIDGQGDINLSGLFREVVQMYAGANGFLGRHRTKVYGFLETAFKVGRSVTIGGFSGVFKERTWEQVDRELEYSRIERTEKFPNRCSYGRIKSVGQTHISATESVKHIVIDIEGSGIIYRPGDRCGILPENSEPLIEQTLHALRATGEETIQLTEEWLKAVQLRYGYEHNTTIDLRTFLRFAKIRPVVPRVAEAMHALTQDDHLAAAIREQKTARWQLNDLLIHLTAKGLDTSRLWSSDFRDPGYIARILPPEQFRMYSISSGVDPSETPTEIHLTVGRLTYREDENAQELAEHRLGTASNFLATGHQRQTPVSIIIDHPPRFSLPPDPKAPIIMIGGGTGFAPFRSFLASRLLDKDLGPSWLLLSLRSREYFSYQDDLVPNLLNGNLQLDVVFSREDTRPRFRKTSKKHGVFDYAAMPRAHIEDLLEDEATALKLWNMLQTPERGGQGAYLYICGRTRFAKAIQDTLLKVFARFLPGSEEQRHAAAQAMLFQITAEGRFMQEIFTHARPWNTQRPTMDVSEIVLHNNPNDGHWMVIDGVVYDLSTFIGIHPGGGTTLKHYSGLDATQGFNKVHHGHSEIEAMRDMYEIGVVRHLDFKGEARVIDLPGAHSSVVALSALYRKWVSILYLVVEMENALELDHGLQHSVTTRGEPADARTPYKIQRAIETHERFLGSYMSELGGRPFIELWELTRGMSTGESRWMRDVLGAIHEGPFAAYPRGLVEAMRRTLRALIADPEEAPGRDILLHVCTAVEEMDKALIRAIKAAVRRGIIVFEQYESLALQMGAQGLVSALRDIPLAFETYYEEARHIFGMLGTDVEIKDEVSAETEEEEILVLTADAYWTFEEHAADKTVYLRRTPVPIESLESLVASNERIMQAIKNDYHDYGLVVDLRESPQRNDAEFEKAMLKLRLVLSTSFARLALLLETTPGLLQVNRIGRNDGSDVFATLNEAAAHKYAKSGAPDLMTEAPLTH